MPRHTHTWRVTHCLTLGLPRGEFIERFVAWRCTGCRAVVAWTPDRRRGSPLRPPAFDEGQAAWEQRQGTPEAAAARRGQYGRVPHG